MGRLFLLGTSSFPSPGPSCPLFSLSGFRTVCLDSLSFLWLLGAYPDYPIGTDKAQGLAERDWVWGALYRASSAIVSTQGTQNSLVDQSSGDKEISDLLSTSMSGGPQSTLAKD